MITLFTGDPRIFINKNGSSLKFIGGQTVMDAGLENAIIISLFTSPGYWANLLEIEETKKIGSNFEETARLPITVSNMNKLQRVTESTLQWLIDSNSAESITVEVSNPSSYIKEIEILIKSGDITKILLSSSGKNWIFQANNPAYKRGA